MHAMVIGARLHRRAGARPIRTRSKVDVAERILTEALSRKSSRVFREMSSGVKVLR
jgi:hypothetical protein